MVSKNFAFAVNTQTFQQAVARNRENNKKSVFLIARKIEPKQGMPQIRIEVNGNTIQPKYDAFKNSPFTIPIDVSSFCKEGQNLIDFTSLPQQQEYSNEKKLFVFLVVLKKDIFDSYRVVCGCGERYQGYYSKHTSTSRFLQIRVGFFQEPTRRI